MHLSEDDPAWGRATYFAIVSLKAGALNKSWNKIIRNHPEMKQVVDSSFPIEFQNMMNNEPVEVCYNQN